MINSKHQSVSVPDTVLRVVTDLVVVQAAMLAAVVVALQLRSVPDQLANVHLAALRQYYLTVFLPLSVLFPVVYGVSGLYKSSAALKLSLKLRRAAACAAICVAAVIGASVRWSHTDPLLRVAVAVFGALVIVGTPAVRWLKHWAFQHEAKRSRLARLGNGTVLVVGGAGYIGSIVVRKLLKRGYRVRVLDSLVYGDSALAEVRRHPRFEFIEGDCRNMQDVVGAMTNAAAVIHLAAIVGDPACDCDHQTAREVNYAATRMMLEIAKGECVGRFIFASSCSVYGASEEVMDETSAAIPISLYAETKIDSEAALLRAAADDFHPTILRFSTIFGLSPRPRFDLVVNLLAAKAKQEGVVTIYNGEQWRPFLHVADAAEAVIRVLEAPMEVVGGQIYNVGDDRLNHTLTDVADKILDQFPGTTVEHLENSDRRNYRVSFNKIRRQLGFTCSMMLTDGIKELKVALDKGLIADYRSPVYSNVKYLKQYGCPLQKDEFGVQVMAALSQKACSQAPAA